MRTNMNKTVFSFVRIGCKETVKRHRHFNCPADDVLVAIFIVVVVVVIVIVIVIVVVVRFFCNGLFL